MDYIHYKVWDEITYPFLNCWSLGMDEWFHLTLYQAYDYLSMMGLKLNHVSKRGPRYQLQDTQPIYTDFMGPNYCNNSRLQGSLK